MKILFLNGSPNPNGSTAGLAKVLLKGKEYETLNLTGYQINGYGLSYQGMATNGKEAAALAAKL